MGQSGCWELVRILSSISHPADQYSFASFVVGCAFDSPSAYLPYFRSAGAHWSSIYDVHCWFPYGLRTGVLATSLKQLYCNEREAQEGCLVPMDCMLLGPLSGGPTAERFIMSSAVTHMRLPCQLDPNVVDPPLPLPRVPEVYHIDVHGEAKWDLPDFSPYIEVDVHSTLWADSTVIREKSIYYSVNAPTTSVGVFKLAVHSLNTLGEQREVLTAMDWLPIAIWSYESQIESHLRSHLAELESVWSEAGRL